MHIFRACLNPYLIMSSLFKCTRAESLGLGEGPNWNECQSQKRISEECSMMRVLNSAFAKLAAKSWQRFNGLIHLRRSKLWFQLPTWESRSLCTYYPIPCHVKVRIQWHVNNMLVKILKYIVLYCFRKNSAPCDVSFLFIFIAWFHAGHVLVDSQSVSVYLHMY